jgi:hypothetical protein
MGRIWGSSAAGKTWKWHEHKYVRMCVANAGEYRCRFDRIQLATLRSIACHPMRVLPEIGIHSMPDATLAYQPNPKARCQHVVIFSWEVLQQKAAGLARFALGRSPCCCLFQSCEPWLVQGATIALDSRRCGSLPTWVQSCCSVMDGLALSCVRRHISTQVLFIPPCLLPVSMT